MYSRSEHPREIPLIRIAISANFTAEPIRPALSFWGRQLGPEFEVAFAPYNQIPQTLLGPESVFARNDRGVNVVLVRYEDLGQFENFCAASLSQLETNLKELVAVVREASPRLAAPLIVVLCPSSPDFLLEPDCAASLARARAFAEHTLRESPGIQFVDDMEIARLYPVENWYDAEGERLGRIPYTEQYFAALATVLVRRAQALYTPPYKVIAVDCDNTLWHGICGEDGPAGVALDPPRKRLHQFLLDQRDAGMLIVLASKNNEQDVFDTFAVHPEFPLQLPHLTSWRLNWDSKAVSLASLAEELNVGLDSFIFLDDNPKECAEVAENAPEVVSLPLPSAIEDLPAFLNHVWAFDHPFVTAEDRLRGALVRQSLEFGREIRKAASLEEFMAGLNLRVDVHPLDPDRLARVAQLTQRTNQFNTTTIRRTEADIQSLLQNEAWHCLTAEAADRFGDYGLVGAVIVQRRAHELWVDTMLLSCRALGRGVEHRMLASTAEFALDQGLYRIAVPCRPTTRNKPARKFLDSIDFGTRVESDQETVYHFPATELQALRWKPELPESAPVEPKPHPSPAPRRSVDYAHIARDLRSPAHIVAAIRAGTAQPIPASASTGAPAGATEQKLARIWSELLEKPVDSVDANFFDFGGHSLLAVLLLMRIKEEFDVELAIDEVYSGTLTLGGLARTIQARQLGDLDPGEYAALLAEIENLSDDEVLALLEQEANDGLEV